MTYFVVNREAGPAWADGGIPAQAGVDDHAAFMNELAEADFVLFAGPLAGSETGRIRALLIVDAADEAAIHRRLADDPWQRSGLLETVGVEPWQIFVGGDRFGG